MGNRDGFTLLEMLISTVLLSLVLLGLYGALDMQRNSNKHLYEFLDKALVADKGVLVLYRDIFQSDGNISIKNGEFDRLCINSTSNSLHGLANATVCWIVEKENRALLRIEGRDFRLPLRNSDGVEIDEVMKPMELFDIQKDKKKVLIGLQQVSRDPYVFLVQGVEPPPKKKKPPTPPKKKNNKKKNNKKKNENNEKKQTDKKNKDKNGSIPTEPQNENPENNQNEVPPEGNGEALPPGINF